MKKSSVIIICSVVAIVAAGLLLSHFISWPVDTEKSGGNIAKSTRFSRQTATESLTNLEELIATDEEYKNSVVTAYVVMEARAKQFGALVDLSNSAAGGISDYADLLADMNAARPIVENVCTALGKAGADLNAVLGGEKRPELAQNTTNASLAYATLQKQNELANRFIATTEKYLKKNGGSDELKFVRDQWVDYQLVTAALEGDLKSAEALEKGGFLLTPEQNLGMIAALKNSAPETAVLAFGGTPTINLLGLSGSMTEIINNVNIFDVIQMTNDVSNSLQSGTGFQESLANGSTFNDVLAQSVINDVLAHAGGNSTTGTTLASNLTGTTLASNLTGTTLASNLTGTTLASSNVIGTALYSSASFGKVVSAVNNIGTTVVGNNTGTGAVLNNNYFSNDVLNIRPSHSF